MTTIEDALLAARQARPYYIQGLTALTPIEAPGLGTMGVDKAWRLYYDPEWISKLQLNQAAIIIADHELQHLLRSHAARAEAIGTKGMRWNVAADAEINDEIDSHLLPDGAIFPSLLNMPDGLLAEEYLRAVEDQKASCGSGAGGEKLPCELDSSNQDAPGVKDETQAQRIRERVALDIQKAEKEKPGTVPNNMVMWANEIAESAKRKDWKRELRVSISRLSREIQRGRHDYTWARRSRRPSFDVLKPGMSSPIPRIGLLVDTSGSMGGDGGKVLAIVKDVLKAFPNCIISECDTEARIHKSKNQKWTGGGGTDLKNGIRLIENSVDLCVIVTDCETPWPDSAKCLVVCVPTRHGMSIPGWIRMVEPEFSGK